ncbi:alginate lyase family protein [Pontiellaceae bacterium B12219]|nr:alginate lyase family protein [Pontiellaceae bacterium B12219]
MTFKTSFLIVPLIALISISTQALVHPGGWLTEDELIVIRDNVAAQEEPWYGAWLALKDSDAGTDYKAKVEPTSTGVSDFQRDAHAAYTLTIKWVASGEQKYATAAIRIIDDWVNTVTSFDHSQTSLRNGIAGNKMAQAAEILAWGFNGEAGWSPTDIAKAQTWFKEVVYPYTSTGKMRSTNWGTSALAGCMSMAVFCDDEAMFEHACDAYRYGFKNTTDGYCAVTDYIINPEGQCYESGRDQVHTQGGIAHLVETAMTAWNQGVDLVSFADYRLVAGLEYTAKYNVGYDDVPWTSDIPNPGNLSVYWPDGISEDGRGKWSPVYIQAATLFERAGKEYPYIAEVIASPTYSNPETHNSDHPGLGNLCFVIEPEENILKGLCEQHEIPGTIEAEHYTYSETDGQGKTYHDTTKGNRSGVYRTDDVDIVALPDGGFAVTEMVAGEWLTYTVSVPKAGNYDVAVRYAAREEGAIQIGFKDGASSESITLPVTEGSSWTTHVVGRNMPLNQGEQQMKLMVTEGKAAYILDRILIQSPANEGR